MRAHCPLQSGYGFGALLTEPRSSEQATHATQPTISSARLIRKRYWGALPGRGSTGVPSAQRTLL